ncbi:MAG: GNAT family N-acetyltransferase [Ruminococcaceae bacterium]|nr:GNAT family N-acetyltransferase [Oscillospiraceae bacterium]
MEIHRFELNRDLARLENHLRACYDESHRMTSWLPQRLNDLLFRIDPQHSCRPDFIPSRDYIFICEENNNIRACILPDNDAIYVSIRRGFDYLFPEILTYAQTHCRALFHPDKNGQILFLVVTHDSLTARTAELARRGYVKQAEQDYDNFILPMKFSGEITLPPGFHLVYGESIPNEYAKSAACNLGFHPENEDCSHYQVNMYGYRGRKDATMYSDSFECLVTASDGDICSYSFCYVDKLSSTAFIEPVSTRQKYRRMGIGSAMMAGIALRCRDLGIEKCYVNSYDWRRKFYNAAGFTTEDSIGFWTRPLP